MALIFEGGTGHPDRFNDYNYSGDGVDRSRWAVDEYGFSARREVFDKDGFKIGVTLALEQARRQMIIAAIEKHNQIMRENDPVNMTYYIDGVPNISFERFFLY